MTFGEKLQGLRARAGLSQDALAELLDVSRQAVSKWERNEAMPEAEKVVRISRQFGVSTYYLLLEELEEPETPKAPIPAAGPWDRVKRWYRNKGYDFTITSSTAYDHKWIHGRNIFDSIADVVDELFDAYLSRPNVKQPILTQYCDGRRVSCRIM